MPGPPPNSVETVTVALRWRLEGSIERYTSGRRRFQNLGTEAGVYRMRFHDADGQQRGTYVGEASSVRARIRSMDYRPEIVMWIDETLAHNGAINVDRLDDVTVTSPAEPAGWTPMWEMNTRVGRLAAEGIAATREDYTILLNADELAVKPEGLDGVPPVRPWWT